MEVCTLVSGLHLQMHAGQLQPKNASAACTDAIGLVGSAQGLRLDASSAGSLQSSLRSIQESGEDDLVLSAITMLATKPMQAWHCLMYPLGLKHACSCQLSDHAQCCQDHVTLCFGVCIMMHVIQVQPAS